MGEGRCVVRKKARHTYDIMTPNQRATDSSTDDEQLLAELFPLHRDEWFDGLEQTW